MPEFPEAHVQSLVTACRGNLPALTQSLNECLQSDLRLTIGEPAPWDPEAEAAPPSESGLIVVIEAGDYSVLCLIPASLPLPKWFTQPGESEFARLQALAMAWAAMLLPVDAPAERFETLAVENLHAEVVRAQPAERAVALKLPVYETAIEDVDSPPISQLYVVWPVMKSPSILADHGDRAGEKEFPSRPDDSEPGAGGTGGTGSPPMGASARKSSRPRGETASGRARLLAELPVTVSVSLAEKKIELSQLLSLTPGALIIFNKSCEELLDLYVNNQRYCQGEAVKIGEKFGLKVCKVGAKDVRPRRVLNM